MLCYFVWREEESATSKHTIGAVLLYTETVEIMIGKEFICKAEEIKDLLE